LGEAQGVHALCQHIKLENTLIELHIFGDGAEKKELEDYLLHHPNQPIFFHGMIDGNTLHSTLKSFDIAIVPLTTRIYGSVPSKIFEYGSLGFPILYFGGGEGETIVEEYDLGWVVPVGDYTALNAQIQEINRLSKSEINQKKSLIFRKTQEVFDIQQQVKTLIDQEVF
jgi:glycosyltransferase involved in cell wall biosynthesis